MKEDLMLAFIPVIVSSLIVCIVLTPFFRDFFGVLGIVDSPDFHRKAHIRPVPRVGGVALIVAYFISTIMLALGWWQGFFDPRDPAIRLVARLSPAIAIIFIVGLYDDLRGLSPWRKLVGQICAAAYASWIGVRLASPPGYIGPPIVIDLVGIFWLVLCANAFNLIDGIDGLAAGVALIAAAGLLFAALIHHNPGLALVIAPLVGALIGFLYYNFNPASIFLGDCGSLVIGFLLGCYGLMWHKQASPGFGKLAPFVVLALPVFEVILSIFRRFLRNRPIFSSDKGHIHHRILSLGLGHRDTALILYGVATLIAAVAILETILEPRFATALLLLVLVVGYFGLRLLRYPEFGILHKCFFAGGLRGTIRSSIQLHEYEESLAGAKTIEDCWTILKSTCREAKFNYVALSVNGELFQDELHSPIAEAKRVHVMLSRWDEVTFGHDPNFEAQAMLIAPLVVRLQETLDRLKIALSWLDTDEPPRDKPKASRAAAQG